MVVYDLQIHCMCPFDLFFNQAVKLTLSIGNRGGTVRAVLLSDFVLDQIAIKASFKVMPSDLKRVVQCMLCRNQFKGVKIQ